jgi:DNA polymerase III subunit gamma/tau
MARAKESSPAPTAACDAGNSGSGDSRKADQLARDQRYVVVARRYRPRSFGELVGQQHVGQALCNAIETGRVGHAYLFTGARGVGKTSTARIFAKALNDPGGPTPSPGDQSDIAQAIDAGEDVDVLEIDGASNRGIDEIRALRAGVGVRPSRSRYKIYIIDEVHMLTGAAFNALLKTLEEPPPHVKFIFCTTDPEKIPITVLSRCQRFDFAPVQTESIMGRLREIVDAEHAKADDEALRLIARRADGSMRDSQSLLEQVMSFSSGELTVQTVHAMLGTADDARLHELGKTLAAGDARVALVLIDRACGEGVAAGQLTEQLLGYFRDLLTATVGCPAEMQRHTGESLHEELRDLGQQWGLQTVLAIVGMIDQVLSRIRHSLHGRVLLEAALVQICHLPNLQQVADLAASLGGDWVVGRSAAGSTSRPTDEKKKHEPIIGSAVALDQTIVHTGHMQPAAKLANAATGVTSVHAQLDQAVPGSSFSAGVVVRPPVEQTLGTITSTLPRGAIVGLANGSDQRASAFPAQRQLPGGAISPGPSDRGPVIGGLDRPTPPVAAKSRAQRMREIENHPYVKTCLDIFGAEIVRIDPPRPSG